MKVNDVIDVTVKARVIALGPVDEKSGMRDAQCILIDQSHYINLRVQEEGAAPPTEPATEGTPS